jgi:hypothetical protein
MMKPYAALIAYSAVSAMRRSILRTMWGPVNGTSRHRAASRDPKGNSYHGVRCMNVPYSRAVRRASASSAVSVDEISRRWDRS